MPYICEEAEIHALIAQLHPNSSEAKIETIARELIFCGEPAIAPTIAALNRADLRLKPYFAWVLAELLDAERLLPELACVLPSTTGYAYDYLLEIIWEKQGQVSEMTFLETLIGSIRAKSAPLRPPVLQTLQAAGDRAFEPLLTAIDRQQHPPGRGAFDERLVGLMRLLCQIDRARAAAPIVAKLTSLRTGAMVNYVRRHLNCLHEPVFIDQLLRHFDERIMSDTQAQRNAALALAGVRDERIVGPLLKTLQTTPDRQTATAIITTLGQTGSPRVVEPLLALLPDAHLALRQNIITALGQVDDARVVEPLVAIMNDPNERYLRGFAVRALENYPGPAAAAVMVDALRDRDRNVRKNAWRILKARVMHPHAHEPLQRLHATDPTLVRDLFTIINTDAVASARAASEADPTHAAAVEAARQQHTAKGCPVCGSAAQLVWIYYHAPNQRNQGWLTVCDRCDVQVEYFRSS